MLTQTRKYESEFTPLSNLALSPTRRAGIYQDQVGRISSFSPQYDSATGVRANGYRSFVRIAGTFLGILTEFLVELHAKQRSVSANDRDALASYVCCLERLVELNDFLVELESL